MELNRLSLGPLIIPFQTPCMECYYSRRIANNYSGDVQIRLGFENIKSNQLEPHELILLMGLLFARIKHDLHILVQNQSSIMSSLTRSGLDYVDDDILFAPRCKRCATQFGPCIEPWTPHPAEKNENNQ